MEQTHPAIRIRVVVLAALASSFLPTVVCQRFSDTLRLPAGIAPEGIASGKGTEFFVGSLADGTIYKGSYRTGAGERINDPGEFGGPRIAVGMAHDMPSDAVWVAGGPHGTAYVYDADTGNTLAELQLTTSPSTFVNDVVVIRTAAYFTDSLQPVLFRVELDRRRMPTGTVEPVPLSGDFVFVPQTFNANGIDTTPDKRSLIIVNSATGSLYTVDPDTGVAVLIDLGGAAVPSGDGLLLDGRTLYVVQNFLNQVGVVRLSPDLSSGSLSTSPITNPGFMIPTTVAEFGNSLFVVNARLDVPPGPMVEYYVTRIAKD